MRTRLLYGIQQLNRRRFSTLVIALLIASAVCASATLSEIFDRFILATRPVAKPTGLFLVEKRQGAEMISSNLLTYREMDAISRRADIFSSVIAEQTPSAWALVPIGDDPGNSQLASVDIVSPDYFSGLGVRPFLGRLLVPADADSSDIPAVLSNRFWHSEFSARRDILGTLLHLRGKVYRIVGVLPPQFHGIDVDHNPDVRVPVSAARLMLGYGLSESEVSGPPNFLVLTRLRPSVSSQHAADAVDRDVRAAAREAWISWNSRQPSPVPEQSLLASVQPLLNYRIVLSKGSRGLSHTRESLAEPLKTLTAMLILLLFVVCANICGFMVVALHERRRERAIRTALGATKTRLIADLILENLTLLLVALAAGWGASRLVLRVAADGLSHLNGVDPEAIRSLLLSSPDLRVVVFTAVIGAALILAISASSVVQGSNTHLTDQLQNVSGSTRSTPHTLLVALQVALAVVLLYGSSLMIRTFVSLHEASLGFNPDGVLEVDLDTGRTVLSPEQINAVAPILLGEVGALPRISSASYAEAAIMKETGLKASLSPMGTALPTGQIANTSVNVVSRDFFQTLEIPLLTGIGFPPGLPQKAPVPVVVNRAFVDRFIPNGKPLGKLLTSGIGRQVAPDAIIVGVVATSKYRSLKETDEPTYYALFDYKTLPKKLSLYVRYKDSQKVAVSSILDVINRSLGPTAITRMAALNETISGSLWRERLMMYLALAVGFSALLLAILGLYGCLNAAIRYHVRDTAVRVALGASRSDIARALFGRVVLYLAFGVGAGAVASVFIGRLARSFLFGVAPADPLSLALVLALIATCLFAMVVVSSRAAWKTDPATSLRSE
jgi:predicted permease